MTEPAITAALTAVSERLATTGNGAAQLVTVPNNIAMREIHEEIRFLLEQSEHAGATVALLAPAPGSSRPALPWEGTATLVSDLGELAGSRTKTSSEEPLTQLSEHFPETRAIWDDAGTMLAAAAATGAIPTDTIKPWEDALTRAVAAAVTDRIAAASARRRKPITIVAEHLDAWDDASQAVIARLAQQAPSAGFHIIATAAADALQQEVSIPFDRIDVDGRSSDALGLSAAIQIAGLPAAVQRLLGAAAVIGTAWDSDRLARLGFDRDTITATLAAAPGARTIELLHPAVDLNGRIICSFTSDETHAGALLATDPAQRQDWFDIKADTILGGATPADLTVHEALRYVMAAAAAGPEHRDQAISILLERAAAAWKALAPADTRRFAEYALDLLADHPRPDPRTAAWRSAAGHWCLLTLDRCEDVDTATLDDWFVDAAPATGPDVRTALARARLNPAVLGLDVQLRHLEAAWDATQAPGTDPVQRQAALVCYARQFAKRNLAGARALLEDAGQCDPPPGRDPALVMWRTLTGLYEAVLAFDAGRLDEADNWLALHRGHLHEATRPLQTMSANFAAQTAAVLGDLIRAETILTEAVNADAELGLNGPWQAYNTALLADIATRIDPHHPEALQWVQDAWEAIQADGHANLLPLIGIHRAETLSRTAGGDPAALGEALIAATEMDAWGADHDQPRIRIMAAALCADLHVRTAKRAAADLASETALALLESTGPAPALNLVEVLHRCAVARPTQIERDRVMTMAREAVRVREAGIESPYRLATYRAQPLIRAVRDAGDDPGSAAIDGP